MVRTRIRQDNGIQSTEQVKEDLVVTDGYIAAQNNDGYSLQDDVNYLRTALKNLKGTDGLGAIDQQRFSSDHNNIQIASDGYSNDKGLPDIDATATDSIVHALWKLDENLGGAGGVAIGPAEDGTYDDGLFQDFETSTPIGTPIDRFNELFKELVPPSAPGLVDIDYDTANGVAGNVSFGSSNTISGYSNVGSIGGGSTLDINGLFSTSGSNTALRQGIYAAGHTATGTLAEAVAAHTFSYPANAFAGGITGSLVLEVNGTDVHSVDLSSFGSGSSLNANGSGFTLTAASNVQFDNGNEFNFDDFKYRTGTWTVGSNDMRNGWNYMRVRHDGIAAPTTTNYFEWIIDADTSATSFSGETLTNLSLAGSKYLSGVQYYTSGTADYSITIDNPHRNTYSDSNSAISHPTSTNTSLSSSAFGTIATEGDQEVLTNVTAVVDPDDSEDRILGGDLTLNTRVDRTVQSDLTSPGASGGWRLLFDNNNSSPTNTTEQFNDEGFRQRSDLSITSTSYSSGANNGPANWDSTQDITTGSAGHTDGLIFYDGTLRYPTQGFDAGDFRNTTDGNANGPTVPGGHNSNPNYSSASGERTYLRYIYDASVRQNFVFNVSASNTTFVAASNKGSLSGNNVTMELLAPNTTVDGSSTVEWKDMVTAYTTDAAIGVYAASFGNTIPTNWGVSIGTKSTATSGNAIVVRITAPASWSGHIDNITVTFP